MARFRLILINLAIWLTLLFNLERPDIVGISNIDLASPVYVYAAVLTVVILMFPDLSHVHPSYLIIPGIGVYLAFGFIIGNLTTDVIFVYTTIIEIVAIAITIALARLVSSTVTEFENVVENTALTASNSRVLPQDEGIAQIDRELFRARRFLHPTALLFLDISSVKKSEVSLQKQLDLQLALEKRYLQGRIARTIEQVLYPDDILSLYHDDLVLCFPETNLDQATEMANEIYKLLGITLRIKMSIGIAAFPEDALIFEELIAAAKSNIKSFNDEYTNNDDEPSDGSPLVSQNGGRYPEGLSEEPATPPSFLSEALPTSLPIPLIENQVDAGTLSYTLTQSNESRSEIRGDLGASSGTGTLTLALAGQSNRTTRQNEEVAPTQRLSNIRLLMDAMFTTPRLPFSLSNEIGEHSPDTD
ncbi:MAG: hypothetical protein GYB66_05740, partial [Chloroflexi bacterium]|nr:hypothetical protein [Chloroflexota bacterium]